MIFGKVMGAHVAGQCEVRHFEMCYTGVNWGVYKAFIKQTRNVDIESSFLNLDQLTKTILPHGPLAVIELLIVSSYLLQQMCSLT